MDFLRSTKPHVLTVHLGGEGTFLSSNRLVFVWQGNTASIRDVGQMDCVLY